MHKGPFGVAAWRTKPSLTYKGPFGICGHVISLISGTLGMRMGWINYSWINSCSCSDFSEWKESQSFNSWSWIIQDCRFTAFWPKGAAVLSAVQKVWKKANTAALFKDLNKATDLQVSATCFKKRNRWEKQLQTDKSTSQERCSAANTRLPQSHRWPRRFCTKHINNGFFF